MSYVYEQSGMGYVGEVIGGIGKILEPIAVGGALAYSDYQKEQMQKRELKARRAETAAVLEQREREARLQAAVAQQRSVTDQVRSAARNQGVQVAIAGAALVGVVGTLGYLFLRSR